MQHNAASVAIADDHQLFLKLLGTLVNGYNDFHVIAEALNGKDLIDKLNQNNLSPDIVLLDVNMDVMNGEETAKYISQKYPLARIVALSMKDDNYTIISMLKAGCCAYLLKDIHPNELERALTEIHSTGYYNADVANINYRRMAKNQHETGVDISDREKKFLDLASSDSTYKQIASEMCLSERTIDGYRESLFKKFNVQSRVGLILEALRRNIIQLNN